LTVAIKAADFLVNTFSDKGSLHTPGHQEIEIALLRLYEVNGTQSYLDLAYQFLHQRGNHKSLAFSLHMLGENQRLNQHTAYYKHKQNQYELIILKHRSIQNFHHPIKSNPCNQPSCASQSAH
jgi:hypothetical protein